MKTQQLNWPIYETQSPQGPKSKREQAKKGERHLTQDQATKPVAAPHADPNLPQRAAPCLCLLPIHPFFLEFDMHAASA
jgi:hypothetical protein